MYIIDDELYHSGIHGQKWGLRRYQNKDGSLTEAGKVRYRGLGGKVRYANDMAKNAIKNHKQKKALAKARKTKAKNKEAAEKLAANKKEWAKSAALLEKHIDDFTADEYKEAVDKLRVMEDLKDIKLKDAQRMQKYANIGLELLKSGIDAYSKTEAALKLSEDRERAKSKEDRDKADEDRKDFSFWAEEQRKKTDEDRKNYSFWAEEQRKKEKHDKEMGRDPNAGKPKDPDSGKPKDSGDKGSPKRETVDPEVIDPSGSGSSSNPRHTGSSSKKKDVFDAEYTERDANASSIGFSPKLLTYKTGDIGSSSNSKTAKNGKDTWDSVSKNSSTTIDSLNDTFDDIDDLTKKWFKK